MKKIILALLITFTALLADFVMKEDGTLTLKGETVVNETVPYTVVPGLYGFGTDTRAAYGGSVDPVILHVNTLAAGISNTDSTHGTFRWALAQTFPRVVVFDVAGIIDEAGTTSDYVPINNPYITIAGQTAPGNIILNGAGIRNWTHDVLIQHFTIRNKADAAQLDCFLSTSEKNDVYNVVLDHISASWAADEQIDFWRDRNSGHQLYDITIANSIIGESIEPHSRGGMSLADNVSWLGNLFTTSYMRSPMLKLPGSQAIYNNIIYNWRHSVFLADGEYSGTGAVSFVGNHAIKGAYTTTTANQNRLINLNSNMDGDNTLNLYMADNIKINEGYVAEDDIYDQSSGLTLNRLSTPIDANGYVIQPASATRANVLANAGARPNDRDTVDTRLINSVNNGTGVPPASVPTVPSEPTITRAFIPVSNPHAMYNANYTNLEHQLHQLATAVEK